MGTNSQSRHHGNLCDLIVSAVSPSCGHREVTPGLKDDLCQCSQALPGKGQLGMKASMPKYIESGKITRTIFHQLRAWGWWVSRVLAKMRVNFFQGVRCLLELIVSTNRAQKTN